MKHMVQLIKHRLSNNSFSETIYNYFREHTHTHHTVRRITEKETSNVGKLNSSTYDNHQANYTRCPQKNKNSYKELATVTL